MVRYPHTLIYTVHTPGGNSYQDEAGKWITPEGTTDLFEVECRAKPNSFFSSTKKDEDTKHEKAAYIVYVSLATENLKKGQLVAVKDGERLIVSGAIREVFRTQGHVRFVV